MARPSTSIDRVNTEACWEGSTDGRGPEQARPQASTNDRLAIRRTNLEVRLRSRARAEAWHQLIRRLDLA
jgi:hypothetical protein